MGKCERCEGDSGLSYNCNECGGTFCTEHRLPEAHNCEALRTNSPGWFKDDLSSRKHGRSSRGSQNNPSAEDSVNEESGTPTCYECGRITEQTCEECGGPYCKRHKSPRTHNCAFLGETETPSQDEGSYLDSILALLFLPFVLASTVARWAFRVSTAPVRNPALGVALLLIAGGALATTGHLDGVLDDGSSAPVADGTTGTPTTSSPATELDNDRVEQLVHERINEERGSPLRHDPDLRRVASAYSKQMATEGFYSHESPSGEDFQNRYEDAGISCEVSTGDGRYATGAENILYTYAFTDVQTEDGTVRYDSEEELAEGIVEAWMNSEGHRENIMKSYWQNEGIGVYAIENPDGPGVKVYATQNFC